MDAFLCVLLTFLGRVLLVGSVAITINPFFYVRIHIDGWSFCRGLRCCPSRRGQAFDGCAFKKKEGRGGMFLRPCHAN